MPSTETGTTIEVRGDLEIVQTRVFDAPRELVYRTINDPDLIPRWWGPEKYPTTVDRMDVREGGEWRFVSQNEDGTKEGFHGKYLEVVPNEKVVLTWNYEGIPGDHEAISELLLSDEGGKTRMTSTMTFKTREDRDGMVEAGMEWGARETDDRLAALLKEVQATPAS